jgi:hypothetical protein
MTEPTSLEKAVLSAIVDQLDSPHKESLAQQIAKASVISRKNTGGGFYTDFEIGNGQYSPLPDLRNQMVVAHIEGLQHGMGFILWVKDGHLSFMEGYSYGGEATAPLNFETVRFELFDLKNGDLL